MALGKHAGQIASPIASRPSSALLEEFRVVLKSGLDFDFWMILNISLPAVRDHPTGDKVIIIRIELVFAKPPLLISEIVGENFVL